MNRAELNTRYPFALKKVVREGLKYLRNELGLRFQNIFDCFSYFDASGDWDVKVIDLLVGIRRLEIDLHPIDADETLRQVDKHNDGKVDPKTFIQLFSWHPLVGNWRESLEATRGNRKDIIEKAHAASQTLFEDRSEDKHKRASLIKFPPPSILHKARKGSQGPLEAEELGSSGQEEENLQEDSESGANEESKQEQAAAILIQKRIRGMQTRKSLCDIREPDNPAQRKPSLLARERSLVQELVHQDAPTLGGRELDAQEQEMLGQIQESRRRASKGQRSISSSDGNAPAVRGRRLDDNVTLPMNDFSIAKTPWILTLFDYLCVRVDQQGRRTTKIGEGQVCEGIIIPDTIIYRQNTIDAWYFTDSSGRLSKKQHTKEFSASNILSVFLARDRLHCGSSRESGGFESSTAGEEVKEPVAYFIELSEDKRTETYRWMDRSSLELFVRSHHKPRSGILQKYVRPNGSHNHTIRTLWTPHHHHMERCSNLHDWRDLSLSLHTRMSTFEGPAHVTETSRLNQLRSKEVAGAARNMIRHVNSLLPGGCNVWAGTFYFKVNPSSQLVFLWTTELQVRNSFEVNPGFVARPYNHVDERPAVCYESEMDRRKRITAALASLDHKALEALTKHDRKALKHLYQQKLSLQKLANLVPSSPQPSTDEMIDFGEDSQSSSAASSSDDEQVSVKQSSTVPSVLPKLKRRHLRKFFVSFEDGQEASGWTGKQELSSPKSVKGAAAPQLEVPPPVLDHHPSSSYAAKSNAKLQPSLESLVARTAKWRPSAGVINRSSGLRTPRLADLADKAGEDRVDLSPLFLCPLPSAVCLKKAQPLPARTLSVTYRQCLAILGPQAAPVLDFILSAGPDKRLPPDGFLPSLEYIRFVLHGGEEEEKEEEEVKLKWKTSQDDLIMRTLLQAQQKDLKGISISEMVNDGEFLTREVEVCESCALLINRWAQFNSDLREQVAARIRLSSASSHAGLRQKIRG
uniref:Calmodulin n=1 Tax=Hanusia phi TaxID=3032 RepID=A0A7S0DVZ5_9CRYP